MSLTKHTNTNEPSNVLNLLHSETGCWWQVNSFNFSLQSC